MSRVLALPIKRNMQLSRIMHPPRIMHRPCIMHPPHVMHPPRIMHPPHNMPKIPRRIKQNHRSVGPKLLGAAAPINRNGNCLPKYVGRRGLIVTWSMVLLGNLISSASRLVGNFVESEGVAIESSGTKIVVEQFVRISSIEGQGND